MILNSHLLQGGETPRTSHIIHPQISYSEVENERLSSHDSHSGSFFLLAVMTSALDFLEYLIARHNIYLGSPRPSEVAGI